MQWGKAAEGDAIGSSSWRGCNQGAAPEGDVIRE